MMKRKTMSGRKSRRLFSRTADRTHSFNLGTVNRGGIRM